MLILCVWIRVYVVQKFSFGYSMNKIMDDLNKMTVGVSVRLLDDRTI